MNANHALSQLSYSPSRRSRDTCLVLLSVPDTRDEGHCFSASRDAQNHRCVAPESFEAVELAFVRDECMDDHVAEIDKYPASGRVALEPERPPTGLLRPFADRVRDGLHLTLRASRADHEEVRDGGELGDVEDQDVLRLPVARGLHHDVRDRSRREVAHRYRPRSSI